MIAQSQASAPTQPHTHSLKDGAVRGVQVLASTAIFGVLQAVVGGQPLLIVGVAEPLVITYGFMYAFAASTPGLGPALFLPWAAWTTLWCGVISLVLASVGAARYVRRFTFFAADVFGAMTAVLFVQQAVRLAATQFREPRVADPAWRLVNGVWSLFVALGLAVTALTLRGARAWRVGGAAGRGLLADYGAALAVLVWSALSFAISGAPARPPGVPARLLFVPPWVDVAFWGAGARGMGAVPGWAVAAALVPGAVMAVLFYFDHGVSARCAVAALGPAGDGDRSKPETYAYDQALMGACAVAAGLAGLPPTNGVLPQAPMHTHALSVAAAEVARARARKAKAAEDKRAGQLRAAEAGRGSGRPGSQAVVSRGAVADEPPSVTTEAAQRDMASALALVDGQRGGAASGTGTPDALAGPPATADPPAHPILETRLAALLQSLGVAAALGAAPALALIPRGAVAGYFLYMALEFVVDSDLAARTLWLLADAAGRRAMTEGSPRPRWAGAAPTNVARFTLLQLALVLGVWGVTWIPLAGIAFPLPIMALVPARDTLLVRWFGADLEALDPGGARGPLCDEGCFTGRRRRARRGGVGGGVEIGRVGEGGDGA